MWKIPKSLEFPPFYQGQIGEFSKRDKSGDFRFFSVSEKSPKDIIITEVWPFGSFPTILGPDTRISGKCTTTVVL